METITPALSKTTKEAPPTRRTAAPFDVVEVILTKREHVRLKTDVAKWKGLHRRVKEKNTRLEKENKKLRAQVRDLKQRLYGRKTESRSKSADGVVTGGSGRPRGQRKGKPGHGRTSFPADLPRVEEYRETPVSERLCPVCGEPFAEFSTTEDSEIIEIEVRPHVRVIRRKRYRRSCSCEDGGPRFVTAPPAPRVLNKSKLGVSVWCKLLIDKFTSAIPMRRTLAEFARHGLALSAGTVVGGLERMLPLFEPLTEAMFDKQLSERVVHADETRWLVFVHLDDKADHKWFLWVTRTASVSYYRIEPSRGAKVLTPYMEELEKRSERVTMVCDRYSVYKSFARRFDFLTVAFCWAHVRRDFLDGARRWPELDAWMSGWVDKIGNLYDLNKKRLSAWNADKGSSGRSERFAERQADLAAAMETMRVDCARESARSDLHDEQEKLLKRLKNHWKGLSVFLNDPNVPMDNNPAERALRMPVCGRKNYYGSGSRVMARFTAAMFTALTSVKRHGLNLHHWLHEYLSACAENGGRAPDDLSRFLPWEMDRERRERLRRPLGADFAPIPPADDT